MGDGWYDGLPQLYDYIKTYTRCDCDGHVVPSQYTTKVMLKPFSGAKAIPLGKSDDGRG